MKHKKSKGQRSSGSHWTKSEAMVRAPQEQRDLLMDFWWLLPALLLGILLYLNTLGGEFIYDDARQIVRNTLIQDSSQFWRALTSDVWAFKGSGEEAASNYWRPSFVFWMILNFRCFGPQTFGWHLTNILLHVTVVALAFVVLRRLNLSRPVAGVIALLFAVHPVHSESVAWISGAPDLILGAALLGSIWFVIQLGEKTTGLRWAAALAFYAAALGAKEVAVLYPLIVVAVLYDRNQNRSSWSRIFSIVWPFAIVSVIYLITRYAILGVMQQRAGGGANPVETILSAPAVFAFYLRQMIAPYWIGPSYPLRAVTSTNIGLYNFVIPLIVTVIAGWWMIRMAKQSKIARIGLALFWVPLLPTFNIGAFQPEQLVHDRYLYVPLLGFLVLMIPALGSLFQRIAGERMRGEASLLFVFTVLAAIPLSAQTVRYNRAWTSNLALWELGVRSDPASAFNYQQYGVQLHQAKRLDEAIDAFDRSIQIHSLPPTLVSRATVLIDKNRFGEAERDLREVTSLQVAQVSAYTMYQAYERLAIAAQQQRKFDEAVKSIDEARRRLPQYKAALTEKLAVILYQSGQKQEALNELRAVRDQARIERLAESRLVSYRLGLLNAELGHQDEAREAFAEFLILTKGMLTPEIKQARSQSEAALRNMRR
jgi:protein O-mannosyl-transferase